MSEDPTSAEASATPAGWYPDPNGSGSLFYWNGLRWTGDLRAPVVPAGSSTTRKLEPAVVLVACGGGALAIAPFLTWVEVVLFGNLNLFQLFNVAGRPTGWPWAAVLAGAGGGIVVLLDKRPSTVRWVGFCVGLIGGAIAAYALIGLRGDVREAQGLAAVGIGPYVAVAGCVAMVLGAVKSVGAKKRTGSSQRHAAGGGN